MNYFELFGIEPHILINKDELSKKYISLQKKYHPDFFTTETDEEQQEALEKSSAINKAFKILQKRDATIKYILELQGLIEDDEKYALPNDFLMEVMELNENFDNNTTDVISELGSNIYGAVSNIIDNYNHNTISLTDLLKLKDYYYKKKYLNRILDRLEG